MHEACIPQYLVFAQDLVLSSMYVVAVMNIVDKLSSLMQCILRVNLYPYGYSLCVNRDFSHENIILMMNIVIMVT